MVEDTPKLQNELFLWCNKPEVTSENGEACQVYAIKRLINKDRARCKSYRVHVDIDLLSIKKQEYQNPG